MSSRHAYALTQVETLLEQLILLILMAQRFRDLRQHQSIFRI
jgi:hypothetical protein